MEVDDPMDFIETQCLITTSQVNTLSATLFARDEPFSLYDDDANDTAWPEFSDDDLTLSDEDVVQIVFRSPPPTPEPNRFDDVINDGPNDVVGDSGVSGERKELKLCDGDGNDVVSGVVKELGSSGERNKLNVIDGDDNDVVSGERVKMKSCDGDGHDVVSGIAEDLGLRGERKKAELCEADENDVVSDVAEDLGFCGERKGAMENSASPSSSPPTTAKKKLKLRDDGDLPDLNTLGAPNDVVYENSAGGFPVEITEGGQDDVVYGNSVELGLTGERKRVREESMSISPPMISATAKKLRFSDGTDVEERGNAAEGGGATQVVNVEDDDGERENVVECDVVLEDVEAPVIDTEQVIVSDDDDDEEEEVRAKDGQAPLCDTEQVNVSDEGEEDEIDSNVVTEEDKLAFDRNSKAESSRDTMKCLLEMLTVLSDRKVKEVEEVDLLETAKRRGYTFPPPRWLP